PDIYTLSLHDALPIWGEAAAAGLHEGILAIVFGLEADRFHRRDRMVERRLEMPQRRYHDRVGIVGLGIDHIADGEKAALLGCVRDRKSTRLNSSHLVI